MKKIIIAIATLAVATGIMAAVYAETTVSFKVASWNASTETVSYSTQSKQAIEVTADMSTFGTSGQETYYVVSSDISTSKTVTVNGTVHLILDKTYVTTNEILVKSGSKLHIHKKDGASTAKLEAKVIGCDYSDPGDIYIHDGTISVSNVIGTTYSASKFGDIVIYGGNVTSKAIMGCGTGNLIAIYGGTVYSQQNTYYNGAPIGIGINSTIDTIAIYNANVKATVGNAEAAYNTQSAAVGGGSSSKIKNMIIKKSTIEARNYNVMSSQVISASVGCGSNGTINTLTVENSTLNLDAARYGAGLGAGTGTTGNMSGSCDNINISGSKINVVHSSFFSGNNYYNDYTTGICGKNINISTSDINISLIRSSSSSEIYGRGIYATGTVTINSGTLDISKTLRGFAGTDSTKYVIKGGNIKKSNKNEYADGVPAAVDADGKTAYYSIATITSKNITGSQNDSDDLAVNTVISEITTDKNTKYGSGTNTRVIDKGKLYMYVSPDTDITSIKANSISYGGSLEGSTIRSGTYYQVHNCSEYEEGLCKTCGSPEPAKLENGYYLIYDEADYEYVRQLIAGTLKNGTPANPKANIKLMNDLKTDKSLGTSAHPYKGIYDGGYHKLSSSNTDYYTYSEAFEYADGATIKNLLYSSGTKWMWSLDRDTVRAGLVKYAKGNALNFENVIVKTDWRIPGNSTGRNSVQIHFGTFVGKSEADINIKNCGYIGQLWMQYSNGASGMVGECSSDVKVSIKNSYIKVHYKFAYSGENYAFSATQNTTLEDCYSCISTEMERGTGGSISISGSRGTDFGSGELSSGALAYRMNKGVSTGVWKQTLVAEKEGDTIDGYPNHTGKNVVYNYGTSKYDNHNHTDSYTLATTNQENDTIRVGCAGCGTADCVITAPENAVYGLTYYQWSESTHQYRKATLKNAPAGTVITYYENGTKMDTEPYQAGTYVAKFTLGDKTASVEYTIKPYDRNSNPPEINVEGIITDKTNPKDIVFSISDRQREFDKYYELMDYTIEFENVDAFYYDQSEYNVVITPKNTRNVKVIHTKVNISVEDTTNPTANITIYRKDTDEKDKVISDDTFGGVFKYFVKDNLQLKFSASDNDRGSGIKSIQWFVSDVAYSNTEDVENNATWVSAGDSVENISAVNKKYVYVKATDNSDNSYITGTDGIVIYKDSEQFTKNISYTKTSTDDVTATVTLNGNTLKDIYLDNSNTPVAKENYTIDEDGVITFKHEYLDGLTGAVNGKEYTLTMHYNPAGENYVESELNETPATTALTLYVYKQTAAITDIEDLTKTYNHEVVSNPTYQTISDGEVTIEWYKNSISENNKLDKAPMNVGTYVVLVEVAESSNYKEVSASREFEIKQRPITIVNAKVENTKVYDGNTNVKIINNGELSDNLDGDNLTFKVGNANYANKNVDKDKVVTYSGYELTGSAKDNYILTQPQSTKADITKKTITITLSIKDKQYDGLNNAEYKDNPALVGVVNGDEEEVILTNGVPTFDNVRVGKGISISFTEFSISGEESGNYSLTQPSGITANIYNIYDAECNKDYTVSIPNTNGWLREDFVVTACEGYKVSLTDMADDNTWSDTLVGSEESANSEIRFYLKNVSTGAISNESVECYKLDKNTEETKTVAKVYYDEENFWESFTKELTLNIFRNSEIKMNVEASDLLSGIESVEYYEYKIDDMTALTIDDMEKIECWMDVEDDIISQIEDEKQFVYYIRIIDKAGNITYISTDMAEYDITLPSITEVQNGNVYYTTQNAVITDRNIDVVTLNEDEIELTDSRYTLKGNVDTDYVINAKDKAGNEYSIKVTMKAISHLSEPVDELTTGNVNSEHQNTINDVANAVKAVDTKYATDEEKTLLENITAKTVELTNVIKATKEKMDSINKRVNKYDISKVNSKDKPELKQLLKEVEELINSGNLSNDEITKMNECKEVINKLLEKISEVAKVVDTENTKKVEDITSDNVTTTDKEDLEAAKKDLENALDKNNKNYTKEEIEEIKAQIKNIEDALDVIERVENVEEMITSLGDNIESESDATAVARVKAAYDNLTDYEKSILNSELKAKLEKLIEIVEENEKTKDAYEETLEEESVKNENTTDTESASDTENKVSEEKVESINDSTSGIGTYVVIVIIILLIAGVGVSFVYLKKRNENK